MYADRNILVTGGTGMIGSHLIEQLLQKGAKIRSIVHHRDIPHELRNNGIEFLEGDLGDSEFCDKEIGRAHV